MILKDPGSYHKRIIDPVLEKHLSIFGAVYLKGTRWSGKTFACQRLANSSIDISTKNNSVLAELNPKGILEGETPRLIDEWQECGSIWDEIKAEVSERAKPSQFLLSGSVSVSKEEQKKIHHSGAGRIDKLVLRPCSLFETNDSNGTISLQEMFSNPDNCIGKESKLSFEDMVFALCRGGWPFQFSLSNKEDQLLLAESYIRLIEDDESGKLNKRLRERTRQFLASLARNVQTSTNDTVLLEDYLSGDLGSTRNEFYELKNAFSNQYLLDYTLAWNSNIRSKTAIRTTPKISFADPSIATAVLGLSPKELMQDFNTLGYLFENLVSRDVKVYMEAHGGNIYQYRDRAGLEADLVLKQKNGDYALIEVKLGSKGIDLGSENLLKISKLMSKEEKKGRTKLRSPKFLAVITSTNFAYKREDGVYVLPLGALKD